MITCSEGAVNRIGRLETPCRMIVDQVAANLASSLLRQVVYCYYRLPQILDVDLIPQLDNGPEIRTKCTITDRHIQNFSQPTSDEHSGLMRHLCTICVTNVSGPFIHLTL
jgi:hypothetical protein